MFTAYTFSAKGKYVDDSILPRPNYYELSRDAMNEFGKDFSEFWLDTTYLADGKSSIREWEEAIAAEKPETKASFANYA